MRRVGGLAVYVTSHGFGHLNRAVAVVNQVPADISVTIRSHPNLFRAWEERLLRPATLEGHVSDVGALNPPGDSASVDGAATLEMGARVHAEAMARIDADAQKLRDESDAELKAYESELANARAKAHAIGTETRDKLNAQAEQERKTLEDRLGVKLAEAEKAIANTRQAAMSNVRQIATDAAGTIVQQLTGIQPDAKTVETAVDASLRG